MKSLAPSQMPGYEPCNPLHSKRSGFYGHLTRPGAPQFLLLSFWILTYPVRDLSHHYAVLFTIAIWGPPYTVAFETRRRNLRCTNVLTLFNVV